MFFRPRTTCFALPIFPVSIVSELFSLLVEKRYSRESHITLNISEQVHPTVYKALEDADFDLEDPSDTIDENAAPEDEGNASIKSHRKEQITYAMIKFFVKERLPLKNWIANVSTI